MSEIIHKLKSIEFDVENDPQRIDEEIKQMGVIKFLKLASFKKDIKGLIDLYVCDMRISRFFWRHIRRLEVNAKSVLINFFFEEKKKIDFIWNRITNSENETILETKKINKKLALKINKKLALKINKKFALKYLKYDGDDSKRDNKTIRMINGIIERNMMKNSGKDIISLIRTISLGTFIDFVALIDISKISVSNELQKYLPINHLVSLRNNISHFHLLCEYYTSTDLVKFWKTIINISENNHKTNKNNDEFSEYIQNFDI